VRFIRGENQQNSGYELRAPLLVGPMWQQPSKCRLGRKAQTQCSTVHNRFNVRCNVGCNVGLNVGCSLGWCSTWPKCGAQQCGQVGREQNREQNREQDASRCLKRREQFCKGPHLPFAARPHAPVGVGMGPRSSEATKCPQAPSLPIVALAGWWLGSGHKGA